MCPKHSLGLNNYDGGHCERYGYVLCLLFFKHIIMFIFDIFVVVSNRARNFYVTLSTNKYRSFINIYFQLNKTRFVVNTM